MKYAVRITSRALREVNQVVQWISERSERAARVWHEQILAAAESLELNPKRCSLAPESEWFGAEVRQHFFGKRRGIYRILFEIRGRTVYILRIRHGARRLLEPGEL
jgi:plasmid stabilization system protein ParE